MTEQNVIKVMADKGFKTEMVIGGGDYKRMASKKPGKNVLSFNVVHGKVEEITVINTGNNELMTGGIQFFKDVETAQKYL